ncbi:MAG: hypothetical protein WAW06_06650 [bacterium]
MKVIACPMCGMLARLWTIRSGNTLDAMVWTDRKMEAPMFPGPPEITRCRRCGGFFWITDAKVVGEIPEGSDGKSIPVEWRRSGEVDRLGESDCLEALRLSVARTRYQQMRLRILAWHAGNDRYRTRASQLQAGLEQAGRSPEAVANLECLIQMLGGSDPDSVLIRAEALRELGRFAEALHLLDTELPPKYAGSAAVVRYLAQRGDTVVRRISPRNSGGSFFIEG